MMEEKSLENYFIIFFQHLSNLSWEKAKEYAEKKRKNLPAPLQLAFASLAHCEKMYFSMEFLEQKTWFGRKDLLKNSYSSLQTNFLSLDKHENFAAHSNPNLSNICLQLADFCSARMECINMYMQIPKSLPQSYLKTLKESVEILLEVHSKKLTNPILESLRAIFDDEMTALLSLFEANHNISLWKFVDSVHSMEEIHMILNKWKPLVDKQQSSSIRSGFFGFADKSSSTNSALFSWMEKLFQALVSKFTFYFYENLSQSATHADELRLELKSCLSKLSHDYISKSQHFMRKNDAQSLCLILDVRKDEHVPVHGYQFPFSGSNESQHSNQQEFFVVLSIPESPGPRLKAITSCICERSDELRQDRLVCCQSGDGKGVSVCAKIEPSLYLALTFNNQKSEKDAHLAAFFNETLQNLKLRKVALSIKPSNK